MLKKSLIFLILMMVSGYAWAQNPCGDQVCDAAEQADPNLCPQDCPNATPGMHPTFDPMREREFMPEVTAVEKWVQVATISERENFAPSIIPLAEGGYRIYWNAFSQNGITSAASADGLEFTPEEGVRLLSGGEGALDCIASHPWVLPVEGGYRMFYHGNAICTPGVNQVPEYRIMSAFSADGLTFEREGVRVDIGEETGLTQAGHGRIVQLADGTYRMYFSANFIGKEQPADILGATSTDEGLTWELDAEPILERGHDPTVIQIEGTIYLYTTFLGDNFLILASQDGYEFTPVSWVEFYDLNGERIQEFGDADILLTAEGQLYLYGSGKGSDGLGVFVRDEE